MNGDEILATALGGLVFFLLAMPMMADGINIPDSIRFTFMAAGAEDRNPDIRVWPAGPVTCRHGR